MINPLEKIIFHDSNPSFYDAESVTVIELTAKLHAKMNEIVTHYNSFVEETNKKITEFAQTVEEDHQIFETALRQEFQDFIDTLSMQITGGNVETIPVEAVDDIFNEVFKEES